MADAGQAAPARWSWKRLMWSLLFVAALGGGLAFYFDAPVAAATWMAANSVMPNGKIERRPELLKVDIERFAGFSPKRILSGIESRPDTWRAIACRSVMDRVRKPDEDWSGALPTLARITHDDPNEIIAKTASLAFANVAKQTKLVPAEFWSSLSLFGSRYETQALALVEQLCGVSPEDKKEVETWARAFASHADPFQKRTAFQVAARQFAGDDPKLVEQLIAAVGTVPMDATTASSLVQLAAKQPGLWEQLLAKDEAGKAAAGLGMAEAIKASKYRQPTQGRGRANVPVHVTLARGVVSQPNFAKTVEAARPEMVKLLGSTNKDIRAGAIALCAQTPGGGSEIVRAAAASKESAVQIQHLAALAELLTPNSNTDALKFDADAGEKLLALANDPTEEIYRPAGEIIVAGLRAAGPRSYFPDKSGPADPKNTSIFRKMIDRSDKAYSYRDLIALSHFATLDELAPADVPKIADAAIRSAEGPLLMAIAGKLKAKHGDHPKVQELQKTLPPRRGRAAPPADAPNPNPGLAGQTASPSG